jgi:7-cyano-7-deazaguanine reductase
MKVAASSAVLRPPEHGMTADERPVDGDWRAVDRVARDTNRYGDEMIRANELERWPNPRPERPYLIHDELPEFTCLCPRSGFPDFATLLLDYVPGPFIVELRSLKLYINGFRDRRLSHEASVNEIAETLVELLQPRRLRLTGRFTRRGNIETTVVVEYDEASGYAAPLPPLAAV